MIRHSDEGGKTWDPAESLSVTGTGFSFVTTTANAVHVIWIDNRLGHKALYYKRN